MGTQIYVVSSGSYSDYGIVAILSGATGQDMNALYKEFGRETNRHGSVREWSERLSGELGLDVVRTAPDGRSWTIHESESGLFIEWLHRNRGFEKLEYDETNFDFW